MVEAGADAQAHLADLADRPLVALAFAKFADGRAFSYARLLRDRHGFRGELRATGDVLIDEIPLMLRCGFDSFDVTNAPTLKALEAGRLPGSPLHYQPGSGGDEAPVGAPHWRTISVGADGVRRSLASVLRDAPSGRSSGRGLSAIQDVTLVLRSDAQRRVSKDGPLFKTTPPALRVNRFGSTHELRQSERGENAALGDEFVE